MATFREFFKNLGKRAAVRLGSGLSHLFGSCAGGTVGILTYHRVTPSAGGADAPTWNVPPRQFQSQLARNVLTRYLRGWLVAAGIVALIVTIDSIGQTMYAVAVAGHLKAWFAGMAAMFGFVSAYGRKLVVLFGGRTQGTRPPLSITVVATVVALLIVAVLAIGFDLMSHAAAWRFCAAAAPDTIVDPYDARSNLPTCPATPERQRADVYWLWLGGAALLTFAS